MELIAGVVIAATPSLALIAMLQLGGTQFLSAIYIHRLLKRISGRRKITFGLGMVNFIALIIYSIGFLSMFWGRFVDLFSLTLFSIQFAASLSPFILVVFMNKFTIRVASAKLATSGFLLILMVAHTAVVEYHLPDRSW